MGNFSDNAVFINGITGVDTSGEIWFQFTELLISAGWLVVGSGDGVGAFDANGDVITSGGKVANGYGNFRAWRRLRDPSDRAEIIIQKMGGTDRFSRIKYSPSARFTGGAPSTDTTPSAVDEVFLKGGGADATPSGNSDYGTPDPLDVLIAGAETIWPYRFFVGIIDVDSATLAPYCAFFRDYTWTGNNFVDKLDTDPTAFGAAIATGASNNFLVANYSPGSANGRTQASIGGTYQEVRLEFWGGAGANLFPDGLPLNPYTGLPDIVPFFYSRLGSLSAPNGTKGWARERGLWGPSASAAGNADARLLNVDGGVRNFIQLGNQVFPWSGQPVAGVVLAEDMANFVIPNLDAQPAVYRMRATDKNLAETVYWDASLPEKAVEQYTGVGPLEDVVVDRILRGRF